MNEAATKAVFLSYASQDAEAAKKICDALRAAGVEVWLDQSELRGGDAWDAKIRKQIGSCALFIPIISASTQARAEGYFRLEWKLAHRRTDLIGKSKAFLLPVCIDDTKDSDADVPDSFSAVQWTWLKGAETTPAFVNRVQKLLGGANVVASSSREGGNARGRRQAVPLQVPPAPSRTAYALLALVAFAMAGGAGWWILRDRGPRVTANPVLSEARQLTARVFAARLDSVNVTRSLFDANDRLCERAATLAPTDPEVWAAWAYLDAWLVHQFERTSSERSESARVKAMRAMNYAPESFSARLALAAYYVHVAPASAAPQAEAILRALIAEQPAHGGVLRLHAHLLRRDERFPEVFQALERLERVPGYEATAHSVRGWTFASFNRLAQFAAAKVEAEKSLAFGPNGPALELLAALCREWDGDLEAAKRTLSLLPPELLQEDRGLMSAVTVAEWRREPEEALRILHTVNRDWIAANSYNGPKALVAGRLYLAAKKMDAAKIEFQTALRLVNQRLEGTPSDPRLQGLKVEVLEYLGETETANVTRRLLAEITGIPALAARPTVADRIAALETAEVPMRQRTAASLRLSPEYDDLRADPRFQALLARAESDSQLSPRANPTSAGRDNGAVEKPPAADKSVAVLAFANLSDDKANEYFSDGISEELLNVLAKVPGLKVTARTSSFFFKGNNLPIPEIAAKLGVAYVIEGSVQRAGDQVKITAQLIKAADGFHVWSDTFKRDAKDVFAVEEEIAGLIARNLSLKLGVSSTAATVAVDPQVLELYLQARQAWNLRTVAGYDRAEELLNHGLTLQPNFARAHAALADVWGLRADDVGRVGRFDQRHSSDLARIMAKARQALALDPDSAEAHASAGSTLMAGWDFAEAERELRRALELNPNYASAHQWLGRLHERQGLMDEALGELKIAAELDPLSARIASNYGVALYFSGQITAAIATFDRALVARPDELQAIWWKSMALARLGRQEEAVALIRRQPSDHPRGRLFRVIVLAKAGLTKEAETLLPGLDPNDSLPLKILCQLAFGRRAEALALLESGALTSHGLDGMFFDEDYDPLRREPRFALVLNEVGLTEAYARAQAWRAAHPPEKAKLKQ